MEIDRSINDNIDKLSLEDLKKDLIGKYITLKKDLYYGDYNNHVYLPSRLDEFIEKRVEIKNVIEGDSHKYLISIQPFRERYYLSFEMIDKIYTFGDVEKVVVKKGDLVKLKNKVEEKIIGDFYGIPMVQTSAEIPDDCTKLIDHGFIVQDVKGNQILPYYLDNKWRDILITTDMVEVVKEDYIGHIQNKARKLKADKKILDDISIIEEMKSKINEKDIRKIYAGALGLIPNNLGGIELLIQQWAFNKKEIYKMLGKELSVKKEVECDKDAYTVKAELGKLFCEIPASKLLLDYVSMDEVLNNKLEHEISLFTGYTKTYRSGEKVSKMIAETFQSEKLNMLFSDIIAKTKMKGIVEVSIDPIEYLLMSCNISGWSSCHTIYKKESGTNSYGCYSAGIFSYMCDSVSLIAFKHDGKEYDFKIGNQKVKARSKNWRQMVWLNEKFDYFVTSRQYPNNVVEANEAVRELIEGSINDNCEEKKWVHSADQRKVKSCVTNYKSRQGSLHYNDILNGYKGDLCYKKGTELKNRKIAVGSFPVCPRCGKRLLKKNSYPVCDFCYCN